MMVTFNRLSLTQQTLNSLFKETVTPFRLIIVDNNSVDGTKQFLLENKDYLINSNSNCLGIDLHFNDQNFGIGIGRNQGLKIASQYSDKYLSTIDNDVLFEHNWLGKCISVLEKNDNLAIGISFEPTKYPIHNLNGFNVQLKPAGNLGTACTVFNRKLFASIGYFITEFGLYGEEDADYFFRARKLGYKLAYLPDNGVHLGEGENDVGEYREFKTKCHSDNYNKFIKTCHEYMNGKRSLYIDWK